MADKRTSDARTRSAYLHTAISATSGMRGAGSTTPTPNTVEPRGRRHRRQPPLARDPRSRSAQVKSLTILGSHWIVVLAVVSVTSALY